MVAHVLSPDFDIATVLCGGFVVSPHAMVVPQSVCLCECVCVCFELSKRCGKRQVVKKCSLGCTCHYSEGFTSLSKCLNSSLCPIESA